MRPPVVALLALAASACAAPGAGGWATGSRRAASPLPGDVAVSVSGAGERVDGELDELLVDALRERGYRPVAGAGAVAATAGGGASDRGAPWTLTVAIRTFDTATLRSQRRIYVELTVRGNDGGGELFRMEWARPTHPVGATATAKRGPHLVEIADAIAASLPAPRTVSAPTFRKD